MSRVGALRAAYGLLRSESRADTVVAVVIAVAAVAPFLLREMRDGGGTDGILTSL